MTVGRLIVDLDAVAANWRSLQAMSRAEAGASVKANAYGLGAEQVALRLAREGARQFFVAEAREGADLRRVLGHGPVINIMSGHFAGDAQLIAGADLTPILSSPEQLRRHFAALPDQPFGLQLDTGMNRLGIKAADWATLREAALARNPRLVMSHLACADEPANPMNAAQLAAFRAMTQGVVAPRSLSASAGTLLGADYHFDVLRPGIALYGGIGFDGVQPAIRLDLYVVQIRDVAPGETVGYGQTWTARRPSRVATLAAGYGDGVMRSLSNRGTLWHGDKPCPLVGRVSMDLVTVDVTDLRDAPEMLTLIGPHQGVEALADAAGTISYEILINLGASMPRRYVGA